MRNRSVTTPGLAIIAAQLSINVGAALGKDLFPIVGPEGVAALRTGIAALILLSAFRPWSKRYSAAQLGWLASYGAALGCMNLLIYWAIERIPIGLAVAIEICGPLAVVLATTRSRTDFVWLALALAGLLLLVPWPGRSTPLDWMGIVCALAAATCWALYILLGKQASGKESGAAVAIGMSVACVITFPAGLSMAGADLFTLNVLSTGCLVAVLSSALPYFLEMKALERLSSRLFGVITSCAPAIAALVGYVILDERLTAIQWLAIVAMITASAGGSLTARPILSKAREDLMT